MSRYFAKGREPISSYTHFWGAVGGAVATLLLAIRSLAEGQTLLLVAGCVLFGLSLVALYTASSVYHYAHGAKQYLRRLRKLDHAMIYVLIAGSYTPFCVAYMPAQKSAVFLACLWAVAVAGIGFKLIWLDAPRWIGTALYLAMGWSIMLDFSSFAAMPTTCLALVTAGGICYTVGAVFYIAKWPNLSQKWGFHELFHLFILAGSFLHFLAVFWFVA